MRPTRCTLPQICLLHSLSIPVGYVIHQELAVNLLIYPLRKLIVMADEPVDVILNREENNHAISITAFELLPVGQIQVCGILDKGVAKIRQLQGNVYAFNLSRYRPNMQDAFEDFIAIPEDATNKESETIAGEKRLAN